MERPTLLEHYRHEITGILSCYDRLLIRGTLPKLCYPGGLEAYLHERGVLLKHFARWAQSCRDRLHQQAHQLAAAHGLEVEYLPRKQFRKEDRVQQILRHRGQHPGLVWVCAALEPTGVYEVRFDKRKGRLALRYRRGQCLHYYCYFIDPQLGLCFARLSSWCPFRLEVYLNGHQWLAGQLQRRGIAYQLVDNLFVQLGDWTQAQRLADGWRVEKLHRRLDTIARRFCPLLKQLGLSYHWSIAQAEYGTDVVFRQRQRFQPLYEQCIRTAIQAVKPAMVAQFLGKKPTQLPQQVQNHFDTRLQGTRLRHFLGPVSIKMYDKLGLALRIETTVNDVNFFYHYREVEQRDGRRVWKRAEMKKGLYNLPLLRERLQQANQRYLHFVSALGDHRVGIEKLEGLRRAVRQHGRSYAGFSFFAPQHLALMENLLRGEFHITGFRNRDLRAVLKDPSPASVSRLLKRLRLHGILRKVASSYRYLVTPLGKQILTTGLKLRAQFLIPQLAQPSPA